MQMTKNGGKIRKLDFKIKPAANRRLARLRIL